MARAIFFYENFADDAIVEGGSWRPSAPLSRLLDQDVGSVARSTDAQTGSTVIQVDLGRVQTVGGVMFGPTNISPGASRRIRSYDDPDMTIVSYDSGVESVGGSVVDSLDLEWEDPGFWDGIPNYTDVADLPNYVFHVLPDDELSQWWKIEIFDPDNADGYLEIGRLFISRVWRPSINYTYGDNPLSLEPLVDASETLGGREDFWDRGVRRTWRCAFPMLPEGEAFGDVLRMMLRVGVSRQMFVVPDPDDAAHGQRRSFLARFKQVPAIQQVQYALGSTVFDLREVL